MTTTATVKHLHIKRRILREVIVFAELLLLVGSRTSHTTPLRASDILQEPVFCFCFFFSLGSGFTTEEIPNDDQRIRI